MDTENNRQLTYNKAHYTIIANDVVRGKQEMTLQEAKLLRLLITQVAKDDKDLKTYTADINELAQFLDIPENNLHRDIRNICDSLVQRAVKVSTGNPREPWKTFSWLQMAGYDGKGTITLMLSEQIKPFVVELNQYFTQYQLSNVLEMRSFYGIRLYELLKTDEYLGKESLEYSIEFLKGFFGCEKKYSRINDFKRFVIDIAVREVNERSDLTITEVKFTAKKRQFNKISFSLQWPHYNAYRRTNGGTL